MYRIVSVSGGITLRIIAALLSQETRFQVDEAELTRLQNQSVAVLAATAPRYALPAEATALLLAVPALCDEVRAIQAGLRDLYAYTVELEGAMAPWLVTRPHMASLPGTQDSRDALGERVRELLGDG